MKKVVHRYRFQLILLVIWLLIRIVINPIGEFTINDDWAYTHNTYKLSEEGVFSFSFWPAMTLITQTLWGTLFCKLFGFSVFNLRMATMVLAILTSLSFFSMLKRETKNALVSFILTLALMSNPFFMGQSFSYMTEIYYLFFGGMALLFFARFFREERLLDWILASVFLVMMVMVRQTGLIFPIAFGVIFLLSRPINLRVMLLSALPFVFTFASIYVYKLWRSTIDPSLGSLSEIGDLFRAISDMSFSFYVERIGIIFHYLGLALIPVSLLIFPRLKASFSRGKWIRMSLMLIPVIYCMLSSWSNFPNGNMLGNFELGPRLLKDVALFDLNTAQPLNPLVWNVVSCLNIISVSVLIYGLFSLTMIRNTSLKNVFGLTESIGKQPFLFMTLFIFAGQLVYMVINPIFFDRYVLPMTFTGLILIGLLFTNISVFQRRIVVGLVALTILVSSLLVRDLMSWNRARLGATNYLQYDLGITKSRIDGGFEFNAYNNIYPMSAHPKKTTDKSWWFVDEDDFIVTCGELEGYKKMKSFPAHPTISTSQDSVFILKKIRIELNELE